MQSPSPSTSTCTQSTRPFDTVSTQSDSNRPDAPSRIKVEHSSLAVAVASTSTSTSTASTTPRVVPSPLDLSKLMSDSPGGTAENPLIPKRRRRTSPTELAILEDEFRANQRPDQGERAKIAQRLGMTNRAIQVWYQNRRQKEKKESSSQAGSCTSSSVASGDLSSPRDLDGVTLSFSSSPLPSPNLPLYPTTAPSRPPFGTAVAASLKGLPSSSDLYSSTTPSTAGDKENVSTIPTAPPPVHKPYVYSYPSSQSVAATSRPATSSSAAATTDSRQAVFLHRPSNTSIITAKKHVRKRPLGSHAPLARTPSLSHTFDFPPSPPKSKTNHLGRSASVGCPPSQSAARMTFSDVASRRPPLGRRASSLNSTSSLFDLGDGERMHERSASWIDSLGRRRSAEDRTELHGMDGGGRTTESNASSRQAVAEDLLQHMQSDPPSASSPAPLIRTRVFAHNHGSLSASLDKSIDESDEDDDNNDKEAGSFDPSIFASKRPPLQQSRSYQSRTPLAAVAANAGSRGGDPKKARVALLRSNSYNGTSSTLDINSSLTNTSPFASSSTSSNSYSSRSASRTHGFTPSLAQAADSARAGTEDACALNALERKRARILRDDETSSTLASSSLSIRSKHHPSTTNNTVGGTTISMAKRRRSSALSAISTRRDSIVETDSEMGDLSFSSTSTSSTATSTVESVASIDDHQSTVDATAGGGYFAPRSKSTFGMEESNKVVDDERECAELLLGLGGFF